MSKIFSNVDSNLLKFYVRQVLKEANAGTVIFYRGEPLYSKARLRQLQDSVGKEYPIFRRSGEPKNIGSYVTPDKETTRHYIEQSLAGGGSNGGAITKIAVDLNSFRSGDGGIDEAVIITNIAGLVSPENPDPRDPLRIKDRKMAMLKYLGPSVKKYLEDPILSDPKLVSQWYDPDYAQDKWEIIKSGMPAVAKPGEDDVIAKQEEMLGSLAEKMRRDPKIISYFLQNKPNDWVEFNFRINSDGSGTKVLNVEYIPPKLKESTPRSFVKLVLS